MVATAERPANFNVLDHIEIIAEHDGLYEARVPLEFILREKIALNEDRVLELMGEFDKEAENRPGTTGQLLAIGLAHVPGFPALPIYDGFHRDEGLRRRNSPDAFATIRPNSSWEQVIDLRIFSSPAHNELEFARLVKWGQQAWGFSPWAEKITFEQALGLATNPNLTGARHGLAAGDVDGVRGWFAEKKKAWNIGPEKMQGYMLNARGAAEDLVIEARPRKPGARLTGITPAHVGAITFDVSDHPTQRVIRDYVKATGLSVEMTKRVAGAVRDAKSVDDAKAIIYSGRWRPEPQPAQPMNHEANAALRQHQELVNGFYEAATENARLMAENARLSGRLADTPKREEHDLLSALTRNYGLAESVTVVSLSNISTRILLGEFGKLRTRVQTFLESSKGFTGAQIDLAYSELTLRALSAMRRGQLRAATSEDLLRWMTQNIDSVSALKDGRSRGNGLDQEETQFQQDLRGAIIQLPPRERVVYMLFYEVGLSLSAIAKALDQPETEIQGRLREAMADIAKSIGNNTII